MFARKTGAAIVVGLALLAAPAYAQQAAQPGYQSESATPSRGSMMGVGQGSMMGGNQGSMMGSGHGSMMDMMHMMMGERGTGGMGMMSAMAGHVEGSLAFLKTELKITDAQKPLWDKFADALRSNAKTTAPAMRGGMTSSNQSATVPERLAARENFLTARLNALRELKAAADPLYVALSPEQKKTADEVMLSPMGMGIMM
jgi:hypothetical protein